VTAEARTLRILYLDANAQYMNPTASLLPNLLLAAFPEIRFFGPGYTSREELAEGISRWIDRRGPFDAVIGGPNLPFFADDADGYVRGAGFVARYTVHSGFSRADLVAYFNDVLGALKLLPVRLKIVSALNLDAYAATQAQVDRVMDAGVVLIGPNHQFFRPTASWPASVVRRERDLQRKAGRLSDAWLEFLSGNAERVITALHYIGEHEFCVTALTARRWDVAVPGVEYALRRDAVASLRSSRLRTAPKSYFRAFRVANRAGLPVYRHFATARIYNLLFQRTLFSSRIVFTAPGAAGNVIRKFFEIPAAGAVLACTPCNGFDALGFEDGRHYLHVNPADLSRLAAARLNDPVLQDVASAGQRLVMRHHSLSARAEQISQCVTALVRGTYRGATWRKGDFVVAESASAAFGTA
jgi:hypothetical protein